MLCRLFGGTKEPLYVQPALALTANDNSLELTDSTHLAIHISDLYSHTYLIAPMKKGAEPFVYQEAAISGVAFGPRLGSERVLTEPAWD